MTTRMRVLVLGLGITVLAILGTIAVLNPRISHAAPNGAMLTGSVKSDSGEKMEGVAVSARLADGGTINTTVFTDASGTYYFPPLADGKYRVLAQAEGYLAGREQVEINGSVQHQDFVLKETKDVSKQLTGDQWIAALPEDTPQHVKMKDVFENNCTGCHPASYTLQNRFDKDGWLAIINLMSKSLGEGVYGGPDQAPYPIIHYFKQDLAAYLAEMRGPGPSPMVFKPRPRPHGDATLAVVTEFGIPSDVDGGYGTPASDGSDWDLGTPSDLDGNHGIHDTQPDLNGNIWLAYTDPSTDRTLAKIDAKTGEVTNVKIPGRNGMAAPGHGIARDPQGMLWFNANTGGGGEGDQEGGGSGSLVRLDPNTFKYDIFSPPKGMGGVGGILDVDNKGTVWVTTRNGALRFDANTHEFTEFKSVTQRSPKGSASTYGATVDGDGNGWWTQISIDQVDKGVAATGKSQELQVPPHSVRKGDNITDEERKLYDISGILTANQQLPWGESPRRLGGDHNGDTVWVCNFFGHSVMKVDTHTMKTTMYDIPTHDSAPYDAVVDQQHNVWIDLTNGDRVEKFNQATGQWTEYDLPTLGTSTRHVSLLEKNGKTEVYLGYTRIAKVARLQFRTKEDLQALKALAQQTVARNQ